MVDGVTAAVLERSQDGELTRRILVPLTDGFRIDVQIVAAQDLVDVVDEMTASITLD